MFHEQDIWRSKQSSALQRCALGTMSANFKFNEKTLLHMSEHLLFHCFIIVGDEANYLLYSIEQSTEEYAGIVPSSIGSFVDNKFIRILSELGSLHPFQLQEYQMVRVGGQIWYSRETHALLIVLVPGFNLRWCTQNYKLKVYGHHIYITYCS